MARLSEQIIAGLTRPSFSRGMFDIGQSIGRVPQQMRQQRERREEEERLKTEELARRGLFSNAITGTLTPEVMQERLQEPGVTAQDILLAQQMQETGQQRTREAEERRLQPIQARGKGRLKALAMNEDFDPQDDKMLNGYLGMASAMQVPLDEAMDILKEQKGIGSNRVVKTDSLVLRDSVGNKFREVTTTLDNNESNTVVIPVAGNQSGKTEAGVSYDGKNPIGSTTIISRTSGVGGEDRGRLAQEAREGEDFGELKVQAAENILDLKAQRDNIDTAVNLLDTFETEGLTEQLANFIQREAGIQDPNKAEYELIVGEAMYSRLKPLFGGVISEGERAAVEGLYANLKRGNPANKRILMRLRDIVEKSIQKQNLLRNSATLEDYNRKLDKFFDKTGEDNYIAPPESKQEQQKKEDVKYIWNPETQSLEPA